MLAEDVGVDAVDINAAVVAEEVAEAGAIEDGAGADDVFFATFPRTGWRIGDDIDGLVVMKMTAEDLAAVMSAIIARMMVALR